MKKPRQKLLNWCIPVTPRMDELVEELVRKRVYVSKSNLVRDAVKEKLEKFGLKLTEEDG